MAACWRISASIFTTISATTLLATAADDDFAQARASAQMASPTLSKTQRWLHQVALKKIDPGTKLYLSHHRGSGRYPDALWNYDDAAADTYPFLFWAAWYTDRDLIDGPILEVLEAEQRLGNHLDRIPTAVNPETRQQVIKSKDDMIFAASEYVKDGLLPIVEVSGPETPWFERMRGIIDDTWKHADIETPQGKIPSNNIEVNGEQIQVLVRLFTITGEPRYLDWAERLADYYLSDTEFMPRKLRDHGSEIIGGLGLLLAVESTHRPAKAKAYQAPVKHLFDEILKRGVNADGLMYNYIDRADSGLSDCWGYNYVAYLCYDMALGEAHYQDHLRQTLQNLAKPAYRDYPWERQVVDGYADSVEGALYLLNRIHVPEAVAWTDREVARHIAFTDRPERLWTTYKLESNGVRTALQHALMHTRGLIGQPWRPGLELGAAQSASGDDLLVVLKSSDDWSGRVVFDIPRHREYLHFQSDWPRMNAMPEWFTVELDGTYLVEDLTAGTTTSHPGAQLHQGLAIDLRSGQERLLRITPRPH